MRALFGGGRKKAEKKKKKKSALEDGSSKKRKIKKLKLRLKKKKKKKNKIAEVEEVDREYRRSRSFDEDDAFEVGGGFQLDNVQYGGRNLDRSNRYDTQRVRADSAGDGKKFRVKPYHAFPEPHYLTEEDLYTNMMEYTEEFEFLTSYLNPSTTVTRRAKLPDPIRHHFGSPREDGRIGSLRVEVLGCVGLDRSKPEVSVYLVVGDSAFATDIIPGFRSPMWPSSSKRAAVFPLHHAYARLFVGVFDVKATKKTEADHFCGRVAIDLPPMRPDTEYDVTFPLRASTFIYDRRPRGVVRLRFSIHWFSERAVILSYLKRPRNPLAFSRQAKKQPTIPCGDPKTFRNVAVTVHGQDFPGKYTRGAFRATMREFNLYQQNLRFLFKVTIIDCILYENPYMSLYLFSTSMYCVWKNSVRLVPPFFIGWLIFLLYESYVAHNAQLAGHLGYKPLSILEVFHGLLRDGKVDQQNFKPILVKKRARKQILGDDGKWIDIELSNHREFPFSERYTYHKFSASEGIAEAPSKSRKTKKGTPTKGGHDIRTARRLSIYTAPVEEGGEDYESDENSDSDDSDPGQNDDDGAFDQDDDGYGDITDSDDDMTDNDDENSQSGKNRLFEAGRASTKRRIKVGPEQNSDKSGRKVPPQVHLSRVEHMLHRATKNISVEHVHFPPPHLQMNMGKDYNAKGPASDVITAKEKQNFDEFDRLLGFRSKNINPILRITSSFLGPLMRIIRIVVYTTRIVFNITRWTDPFLTFWVFAFLCTLAFVLLIFPWRSFFFFSSLILVGPQNIAIRKYLERRARDKEVEEQERLEREKENQLSQSIQKELQHQDLTNARSKTKEDLSFSTRSTKKKTRGGFFGSRKKDREEEEEEEEANDVSEADLYHSLRPAFYAHTRPTRRTQVPRDVAVPYFRFRKDRFYDWPPDPTVSRATPLMASLGDEDDLDDFIIGNISRNNSNEGLRRRRKGTDDTGSFDDSYRYY